MMKNKVLMVLAALFLSVSVIAIYFHNKASVPNHNALSVRYSVNWKPGDDEEAAIRENEAMWELANRVFVKNIPAKSKVSTVRKILGDPLKTTSNKQELKALLAEDVDNGIRETYELEHAKSYPLKYTWKIPMPDIDKQSSDHEVFADIYQIKLKANGVKMTRYWHIYYLNGRAVSQSYTMGNIGEDYQEYMDVDE